MLRRKKSLIFLLIGLITAFSGVLNAQETGERDATLIIADIDDDPVKTINELQPLADYLASQLESIGIEQGEVMVAPDMDTMIAWLESGQVDIVFDSPYPAMVMINESGAVPVLRRWKDNVAEYHGVFFAMTNSGLETVEDLQGHIIVLDSPDSTSGYMLPKAHLLQLGLNPVEKTRLTSRVDEDEVGYVFSEDDETTVQWVISGRAIAGVIDSEEFIQIPEETRQQMVVLGETDNVPRHLMLVRPGFDDDTLEVLIEVLTAMDEAEESRAILVDLDDTAQFDFFPQGAEAALNELQEMFELVEN